MSDLLHQRALPAATMTQLAFYCAAVGVRDPIHYDREFARSAGFGDAIVNGSLRVAWMAQVLHEYAQGRGARLRRMTCAHRGPMRVGDAPRYEVRLLAQHEPGDASLLQVEVAACVGDRVCDVGQATLELEGAASAD